jgi:hypothetical protein
MGARVLRRAAAEERTDAMTGQAEAWPPFRPDVKLPRSYAEADVMFHISTAHLRGDEDETWVKTHIVECHGGEPFAAIPGLERWYFKIHRFVEPYVREGFARAMTTSPWAQRLHVEGKLRAGGYVYRTIRNRGKSLSPHGRGIAFDVNADLNRGIDFKRGTAPKLWSQEWFVYWPDGVDAAFVNAMKSCGFRWGADWDEDGATDDELWLDPMHFELVERERPRSEDR